MKLLSIKPSSDPKKKYEAHVDDSNKIKVIKFGAKGYTDFILSGGDEKKKASYLARHKKNEDWNNPLTAGFYSRWVLWNKPTLKASIEDMKKRFNL